jgi:tryptophan halogenase
MPGVIETARDLERPGVLGRALVSLGALAAAAGCEAGGEADGPGPALRRLGSPPVLDLLFRLALGNALRRGPGAGAETGLPAGLLALAEGAAASGALPVVTAVDVRDTLGRLEEELRGSGAWDPAAPVWWSPLPPPGPLETLWRGMGREPGLALPPAEELAAALPPDAVPGPGWIAWPGALAGERLDRVAAEIEAAAAGLDLEAGRVGRGARRSSRRSDAIRYLTGLEPEILERAPALAVLVQRLLDGLETSLRRALPGCSLFAPQTVMLARYPAPSAGFGAHLDNPGGAEDNGRTLALILYLNPPGRPCRGGDLSLWSPGSSTQDPPAARLAPQGGSAALLDARATPHAVWPLEPGPDRWSLVLWLHEAPQRPPRPLLPVPEATLADALAAVDDPPVEPGAVVFRRVAPGGGAHRVVVRRAPAGRRPRAGIVATVRGAPHPMEPPLEAPLEVWCRHHLDLGLHRLLLVLDGAGDAEAAAHARDLEERFGPGRVTVWSGAEARRRWDRLPGGAAELAALRRQAEGGAATGAVAARQALNASAALAASRRGGWDKGAGDGGPSLDWLIHLDGDEILHVEGAGRGGASLAEHFAAAEEAGWGVLRYVNHELLAPWLPREPPRFKRNPAVAAARLGPQGWTRLARLLGMEQGDRRPYFRAYWNGKSAVAVAAGRLAAGVHGWTAAAGPGGGDEPFLAGPSILHFHLPTAAAFRRKYLAVAAAPEGADRPFPPSPLERAACSLIRELRREGASEAALETRLDELYAATTAFTPAEVDLLEEADLLFTPALAHPPLPGAPASGGPVPPGSSPEGGEGGAPAAAPWILQLDREDERRRIEALERRPSRVRPRVEEGGEPPTVGILGGGTAGYLAALVLRARRPAIRVTLIESRDVPVIGVGEATTPLMPQLLHADLGVSAERLFEEVRPTFKLGIRFEWGRPGAGGFPYPFGPVLPLEAATWDRDLDRCSLQAALMTAGALPVEAERGRRLRAAFGTEVAYHLDNRRLAAFLKGLALERGVTVVDARIAAVETAQGAAGVDGDREVAALVAEDGRRFIFDLYLDCSGFRSLLVGEALGSPFVGYGASLFSDRALVGAAPHGGRLRPYTEARTLAAGWCWSIPQEEADHVGYVYASAFADPDRAADEIRRLRPGVEGLREVRFRAGRREHFWRGNAVALGNAYGFVEPLESTALHLLIRQIGLLLRALPARRGEAAAPALLNARVAAFWDYVRWFLALHFRFNRRLDTPFWRACREEADVSAHGELLELFRERGPLSYDPVARSLFDYPDPLWGPEGIDTILLGQGVPCRLPEPGRPEAEWREQTRLYRRVVERSLPPAEVLRGLPDHPEVLAALEAGFRRRGPAFP